MNEIITVKYCVPYKYTSIGFPSIAIAEIKLDIKDKATGTADICLLPNFVCKF